MFSALQGVLFLISGISAQLFVNESKFPNIAFFQQKLRYQGDLGLRSTASPRQYALVNEIDRFFYGQPQMQVSYESFDIYKWQTEDDQNLFGAGELFLKNGERNASIAIAGAIPYTSGVQSASLIYIPSNVSITSVNVTDKIVLRDFVYTATPFSIFAALVPESEGYYRSPDTDRLLNTSYARPYTGAPGADIQDAVAGGAVGYISAFNVSREYIQSYWDPHDGLHQSIPGVYVGIDEAQLLKAASKNGSIASLSVAAIQEVAYTKEIFATLPGMTNDTIIIVTHTDGNTWVQDDGVVASLALAEYFAAQPLSTRNKTLQFAFTSGHLTYSRDGSISLARRLDQDYDNGNTVLVLPMEHMGTTEILPVDRRDGGPGQELEFTGYGETMLWCVGPSSSVLEAVTSAVKHRQLDNMFVAPGLGFANTSMVPTINSFGGIGTFYHNYLLPTSSIISGPWSLWAPSFGSQSVDIGRLRNQTLAFGDVILSLDHLSKSEIAGNYTAWRKLRAAGYPTVDNTPQLQFDPNFWPVVL